MDREARRVRRSSSVFRMVERPALGVRNEEEPMSFAKRILTEDLEPLRQRLLFHPLCTGIEQGTLPRETLRVFALQDWCLGPAPSRLPALAAPSTPYLYRH